MYRTSYLLLLSILLLYGCSSGKKQLERGDYYTAILKSANRLKNNPDHKKSRETLKKAYPLAQETLTEAVSEALSANQNTKWRNTVEYYEQLQSIYDIIKKTPAARKIIPSPKNYFKQLTEAKNNAADESYKDGVLNLNKHTREDARKAFFHFQDALNYVSNYKDAEVKMNEARLEATLKVVVEQIPVPTMYRLSADFFQDKVEEFLRSNNSGSQFVSFYTPEEVKQLNLPYVDQILRIQFDNFVVGQEFIKVETESFERDSVEVGEVTLEDGTKKPVFGTVKAKLTIYNKTLKSEGLVSMQVLKPNGTSIVKHEKFNGTYLWNERWASFNGDERALTKEQIKLCERREFYPPPPQELFIRFTEPIYSQLTREIRQFYSQY